MKILLLILFIADVLVHLYACLPPMRQTLRRVTKLLLMPLLAGCYAYWTGSFSVLIVVALLFGFIGDAFLMFPKKENFFLFGLCAFAAGHVCYVITLLSRINGRPQMWIVALAVAAYAVTIVLMLRYLLPSLPDQLVIPCCAYMVLICFMSLSALVYALSNAGVAPIVAFAGSLLFLLSDAILSTVTFKRDLAFGTFAVQSTYIAAQSMLAFGLAAYIGGL